MALVDNPTIGRLAALYPDFSRRLLNVYYMMHGKHGVVMRCVEGVRSFDEQQHLYEQGRTQPGNIVTNVMAGDSLHEYGLAADSCFMGNDPYLKYDTSGKYLWDEFGTFCKMEDLMWGGDFTFQDLDHCQILYGTNLSEIKKIYADGGLTHLYKELDVLRSGTISSLVN